jgi:hypothetical protein
MLVEVLKYAALNALKFSFEKIFLLRNFELSNGILTFLLGHTVRKLFKKM